MFKSHFKVKPKVSFPCTSSIALFPFDSKQVYPQVREKMRKIKRKMRAIETVIRGRRQVTTTSSVLTDLSDLEREKKRTREEKRKTEKRRTNERCNEQRRHTGILAQLHKP